MQKPLGDRFALAVAARVAVWFASVDMEPSRGQLGVMTLMDFPELRRLSVRSRLKIAEELWDSAASNDLPVPASHKALVRSRRQAYARGEIQTLTMSELKKSIRRQS